MLDLGRHGGYILASYAATVVIIGCLIWQTVAQFRNARREAGRQGDRSDE